MSSDIVPNDMKSFLRSVLMSSNGVKESKVERDYRELAGEKLNWKKFGFGSLRQFLYAIPDVCRLEFSPKDKENRVYAVEVKGIYMSSHAKKNVKSASSVGSMPNSDSSGKTSNTSLSPKARTVHQEGDSLKITIDESKGSVDDDDDEGIKLTPNTSGYYQVYVSNLPDDCKQSDLKKIFSIYGKVRELDIVLSSKQKKIAFIRYSLKSEALKALKEGKITPPNVRGQILNLGVPKCKNSSVQNCVKTLLNNEPTIGGMNIVPASTQISKQPSPSPSSPTRPLALGQPRSTPPASPVCESEMLGKHFSAGGSEDDAEAVNEPLFAVNVSGYNRNMKEDDLRKAFHDVGNMVKFEYHSMYSIVKFKTQSEAKKAVADMNGKIVNGSVLLVSALKHNWPLEESKPDIVKHVEVGESSNEDQLARIYSLYREAMLASGSSFLFWLNTLPTEFEVKFMDIIDPCTFWVHLAEEPIVHAKFDDLVDRLAYIRPSPNQKPIEKGEFGAGKFTEDGKMYRCYCSDVSANLKQVHVIYIDYGNDEWLGRQMTAPLPPELPHLRPQGVLVRLSGVTWKPDQNPSVNAAALLSARRLLVDAAPVLKARKASVDFSKPLLLEVELLYSEGEAVYKALSSIPGIEVAPRPMFPVQFVLLTLPPLPWTKYAPLKEGLAEFSKPSFIYIWISNITSPTTFHFQRPTNEARDAIAKIQQFLLHCDIQNKISIRNIKEDEPVCYHKNGQERSRVLVIPASRPPVPGQVNVLHVDTGKEAMVSCTSFISLPAAAKNIPYQARPAILYNVPDHPSCQSEALDFLVQQSKKVLLAYLIETNSDGSVVIELFDSEGESINMKLLEIIQQSKTKHAQDQTEQSQAQETHLQSQASRGQATHAARQAVHERRQAVPGQNHEADAQNPAPLTQTRSAYANTLTSCANTQVAHANAQAVHTKTQAAHAQHQSANEGNQEKRAHSPTDCAQTQVANERSQEKLLQYQAAHAKSQAAPAKSQVAPAKSQAAPAKIQAAHERIQEKHAQIQPKPPQPYNSGDARPTKMSASNVPVQSHDFDDKRPYPAQRTGVRPSLLSIDTSYNANMTSKDTTSHRMPLHQIQQSMADNLRKSTPPASPPRNNNAAKNASPERNTFDTSGMNIRHSFPEQPNSAVAQNQVNSSVGKREQTKVQNRVNPFEMKTPPSSADNGSSHPMGETPSSTSNEMRDAARPKDQKPPTKEKPRDESALRGDLIATKNSLLPDPSSRLTPQDERGSAGKRGHFEGPSLSRQFDWEELKKTVMEQEKILSRPAREQRQLIIRQKMKEKLEVQVRIVELENAIFVLENGMESLKQEKEKLERQLSQ